ncbi:MAG: hypothetical protein JST40_12435 [Armatimonadetes bacterium]|nr:hypothetical protein [Armatimonadota bacterium]
MKKFPVLFAALALVTIPAVSAQESYTLKRVLTKGEKTAYRSDTVVDVQMDASAMGGGTMPITFKAGMNLILTVGDVDSTKGTAALTGKITENEFTMEPDMSQGMMSVPKEFSFTAKLDEQSALSDFKVEGLDAQAKQMMANSLNSLGSMLSFPKTAVKLGDSWKMPATTKMEGGQMTSDITVKLEGLDKEGEIEVYKLGIKGTSKTVAEGSGEAAGGGAMTMTTENDIDGMALVERTTGKLIKYQSSGKLKMTVEMKDMGMTIPMDGSFTSKMVLSKGK